MIERENILGVILFYPYNKQEGADANYKPLHNGIMVTFSDFDELVLYPYVGESKRIKAITYEVYKLHAMDLKSETGYKDGLQVKILGFEVYNDIEDQPQG